METTSLPPSRRREQGERTRDRVLEVATALMAERGYSGTTISAISRASGVMPASIYWHFESKAGLLAAVIERAADIWLREVKAAMAGGSGATTPDHLAGLRYAFEQRPDFFRVLLLISLERHDTDAATLAAVKRVRERCRRFIADRLEEGVQVADAVRRRAICERLSSLVLLLLDGTFIAHQIDAPAPETLRERFEQLAWVVGLASTALREALGDGGDGVAGEEGT